MKNYEIRQLIRVNGLTQWQVADAAGIAESTFCKWLRKELSEEQKQRVYEAIQKLGGVIEWRE